MAWESLNLDQYAHDLVLQYHDKKDALNQAYKMRVTVAYGLERFWGEQLRLTGVKANYWKATWEKFVEIMGNAGITIPQLKDATSSNETEKIQEVASQLWNLPPKHRKVSLAVLTQLCDNMVWWTQRYKKSGGEDVG